jgi:hypothetical protein
MSLPTRSVGFITGHKGEGLRSVEGRTATFIFTNASDRGGETEQVCSHATARRVGVAWLTADTCFVCACVRSRVLRSC